MTIVSIHASYAAERLWQVGVAPGPALVVALVFIDVLSGVRGV